MTSVKYPLKTTTYHLFDERLSDLGYGIVRHGHRIENMAQVLRNSRRASARKQKTQFPSPFSSGFTYLYPSQDHYRPFKACKRFKFQPMHTRLHSPETASKPRSKNWRNPCTCLMMPKTVSTVDLRRA